MIDTRSLAPITYRMGYLMSDTLPYYGLDELMQMIDKQQRAPLQRLLDENKARIASAPGSTHNHQAWDGGYLDHVIEGMNTGVQLYRLMESIGRMSQLRSYEQFSLSDVLIVIFLHDIEKVWRVKIDVDYRPLRDSSDRYVIDERFKSKSEREKLKQNVLVVYDMRLTEAQLHALRYVEGMRDKDYSPGDRVILPLDVLCHTCDLWSARIFYDFPKPNGDAWSHLGRAIGHVLS